MLCSDEMKTSTVLEKIRDFAEDRDIQNIVVASTSGKTGVKAAEIFEDTDINLVVVGHSTGFREENEQEMEEGEIKKIRNLGGDIFIGPMIFHNINLPIKESSGFSSHNLVADVLRLFGQGTKVALESVLMACDAGLIDSGKDVIGIGGTGSGADTGLLIRSSNSQNLFDARIREVIVKPSKPENLIYY